MEATVPWKGGRTVHLVLLFMNSDRGFLLARSSCISTCCTFKWPVCPNLICSLSRPNVSRVVLTSLCMFPSNFLQLFFHLHVCSPHLPLFVEQPCIPLLLRLRQHAQAPGAIEKPGPGSALLMEPARACCPSQGSPHDGEALPEWAFGIQHQPLPQLHPFRNVDTLERCHWQNDKPQNPSCHC